MKKYKISISMDCFSMIVIIMTGCSYHYGCYKKYAILSMTKEEVKYETDKAEKYLKAEYPKDEFIVENIISEAHPEFKYPIYTINCIDKTRDIKFHIVDKEKQTREQLKDNLMFCINSNKKETNEREEEREIIIEIGKYFNIDNKKNIADANSIDFDGGEVFVNIDITTWNELAHDDFIFKTDRIISCLKAYKHISFIARNRYTDGSRVKRYNERDYSIYKRNKIDKIQYALKDKN